MPRRCAAIIAKQPLPGKVKTRLAATIGSDAAARLCESFLRDTVQTLSQLSTSRRCLFFSPITAEPWFSELDPEAIVTPGVFVNRIVKVANPAFESELVAQGVTYP